MSEYSGQEYQKGKVCHKCNKHKLNSEFSKSGLASQCRSCNKEYQDNICAFKKWFLDKKSDAKRRSIEFTIEPTDIPGVKIKETITIDRMGRKYTSWEGVEYPKVCPVLGMKLDWGMNGQQPNSPSLDRDNNKLGYIKGNVILMSTLANRMKQNAIPEQLKQFSRYQLFGNKE